MQITGATERRPALEPTVNVKSSDPIKPLLIAAVRAACPDASKVTNVTRDGAGVFRARVLKYVGGSYTHVGDAEATEDAGQFAVTMHAPPQPGDFARYSGGLFYLDANRRACDPTDAEVTDRTTGRRGYIIRVVRGSSVLVGWRDHRGLVCDQETVDASTLRAAV